jgi:hypothetical protein
MRDNVGGNRDPAPIIAIAAITDITRPIEIGFAIFPRDRNILCRLGALALFQITLGTGQGSKKIYFSHMISA